MKRTVILFSLLVLVGCQKTSEKPSIFQLHLVLDAPTSDSQQMISQVNHPAFAKTNYEKLNVQKTVLLGDSMLKSVSMIRGPLGEPQIDVFFTDLGQEKFAEITRQNIGRRLAVVVDGEIISVPTVNGEVTNQNAQITGEYTDGEAALLIGKINKAIGR